MCVCIGIKLNTFLCTIKLNKSTDLQRNAASPLDNIVWWDRQLFCASTMYTAVH